MKTTLQKKKYTLEEIKKKQTTLSNLKTESVELSKIGDDDSIYKEFTDTEAKLNKFEDKCKEEIKEVCIVDVKQLDGYEDIYLPEKEKFCILKQVVEIILTIEKGCYVVKIITWTPNLTD